VTFGRSSRFGHWDTFALARMASLHAGAEGSGALRRVCGSAAQEVNQDPDALGDLRDGGLIRQAGGLSPATISWNEENIRDECIRLPRVRIHDAIELNPQL